MKQIKSYSKAGPKSKTGGQHTSVNKPEPGFLAKNQHLILLISLLIFTFILYYPALFNSFTNWDDKDYVTENPHIKSLSEENIQYIFSKPIAVNYHPLTIL